MLPSDTFFMHQALKEAKKGLYTTFPNPIVGAVIVKNNEIIATGFHEKAGEDHAEINALKKINFEGKDATLYVTLEPCNHFGKTPPCVDAIIKAKIKRVVIATLDPNPKVNGEGIVKLRAHGIEITVGILEKQAYQLNKGFFKRMGHNLPWVRLKMAMTLDGKIADYKGDSKWITNDKARHDVQLWRARSNVVITGVSTIIKDDPLFTVRDQKILKMRKKLGLPLQPPLVVCDSHLQTPANAKIFEDSRMVRIASIETSQTSHFNIMRLPIHHGRIDLLALMKALAVEGNNEVMVEAGSTLAGAFLEADLVDELILYYAPKLMGDEALSAFHFRLPHSMAEMKHFSLQSVKTFDDNLRIILSKEGA